MKTKHLKISLNIIVFTVIITMFTNTLSAQYKGGIADGYASAAASFTFVTNAVQEHHAILSELQIAVYPNPVNEVMIIESNYHSETIQFEIFNAIGQKIQSGSFSDKAKIQTSTFIPGIYYIKFENSELSTCKKIIKVSK